MEKRKRRGIGRRRFLRRKAGAIAALAFALLLAGCKLPVPYTAKTDFRLENAPDYPAATPAEWRERGYDHGSMADFYFQSQTAEELLGQVSRLEFHDAWLSTEELLEPLSFREEDWPLREGGWIEWNLRVYGSPEAEYVDQSEDHPDIAGFPYFREWRRACLKDRGRKEGSFGKILVPACPGGRKQYEDVKKKNMAA